MNNILIPTDFSESANNAFLYALKVANQINAQLYVLHSYQAPVLSFSHAGQPTFVDEVYNQIELSKFEFFRKQTPKLHKLAEEHGLDHSKIVFVFEEGNVLSTVKKIIHREDIKLVVMGTLGATGFQQEFIGTNTVSVISNTKVPVLCIPEKAIFSDIKKIAFTTLFREKDKPALQEIINLSNFIQAQVYCVHVMNDSSSAANILQQSENWRKTFGEANLEFVFLEKVKSVESTITAFIEENDMNLLAVVKRNKNFFNNLMTSSVSNNLAFHAKTPILVYHEENK